MCSVLSIKRRSDGPLKIQREQKLIISVSIFFKLSQETAVFMSCDLVCYKITTLEKAELFWSTFGLFGNIQFPVPVPGTIETGLLIKINLLKIGIEFKQLSLMKTITKAVYVILVKLNN